jgi:hypothetical protein
MSTNDNNAQQVPPAGYYPPYGYPWYPYPPMPQGMAWPQNGQVPPQPQMPPQLQMQMPPQMAMGFPPMGFPPAPQGAVPPQFAHPHHHHHHAAAQQGVDWSQYAQHVVDGAMGDQAGLLKNIISTVGMDDKEFWKGAMVGAAVTLLLTNDSVRGMLMQTLAGAGDMLKAGSSKVKDGVKNSSEAIKETATSSAAIFRDTMKAGKEGFQESVERHRQPGAMPFDDEDVADEQQP